MKDSCNLWLKMSKICGQDLKDRIKQGVYRE